MTVWNESGPLLAVQVLSKARWFQPVNTVGTVFTEAPTSHVKLWLAFGTEAQRSRLLGLLTADRQGLSPDESLPPGTLGGGSTTRAWRSTSARHERSSRSRLRCSTQEGAWWPPSPWSQCTSAQARRSATSHSAAVRQVTQTLSRELGYLPESPRSD